MGHTSNRRRHSFFGRIVRSRYAGPLLLSTLTVVVELSFDLLDGASAWAAAGTAALLAAGVPRVHQKVQSQSVIDSSGTSKKDRRQLYREQALLAWSDQAMTRRERLLLDHLRMRLALTFEEASRIEAKALGAALQNESKPPGAG